ncbi:hypothetical protein CPB83DRAFT_740099, partial [Crepidotus variabilis]
MPVRGSKNAPKTFQGKSSTVLRFIDHVERLFALHHIVNNDDRCNAILDYVTTKVADFIRISAHFPTAIIPGDWDELRDEILKYYDADRQQSRYKPADLQAFLRKSHRGSCSTLTQWKKYYRTYSTIAGQLRVKGVLNLREYQTLFWKGLPSELQRIFEAKLLSIVPNHNLTQPYEIADIITVAERHFLRNKFTEMTMQGYDITNLSETDSDDEDSESEDSDSSEEEGRRKRRIRKSHQTRRTRRQDPITVTYPSNPEPDVSKQKYEGSAEEVESMIKQLNTMSLHDPAYGHLYYRVLLLDPTGMAAKCI